MSHREVLPTAVKPTHYDLTITSLDNGAPWTYHGHVKINLDVHGNTDKIVLNSNEIEISQAHLSASSGEHSETLKAENITYDEHSERATLHFPSGISPGPDAVLDIQFTGTINSSMVGFSRARYKPTVPAHEAVPKDDDYHYMFSTQFEACDARRAFPCWDEPALKSSFDFAIEIPDGLTALSNMPIRESKPSSKPNHKIVAFETTPIMSTYLLAWAVGDFEYVEAFTERKYGGKNVPVRVYTTRGLKEQGRFALDNAWKVIDMFSAMFEIDYVLPKYDMLAVHEFGSGAMENWGLVTYRTTRVLFDEESSDQKYKTQVAYVVAHETAHQWFGNLCTMQWWDSLWLNESFATWVGWYAVDKLYPEWKVFGQFITEGMQTAFGLDALRSSHPIEVPIRDSSEVDQIFDPISYLKGCSVIRMIAGHLGVETFLLGVSNYLKAHAYGNARTDDLWSALSEASGIEVNSFANTWIRAIGFPVLIIAEEPDQVSVRQERYLTSGDVTSDEDKTEWWLPLGFVSGSGAQSTALTTREDTLRDIDTSFYKFNKDSTGFYRCNYPPGRLATLGSQQDRLSVEDRIGLVADAAALAVSGHGTTAAVLAFLEQFRNESSYLVWAQILTSLDAIRAIFADNVKVAEGLRKFTLKLVTPATERVGWEFPAGEDYRAGQLRALLISRAGLAGHEDSVREATHRFEQYTTGKDEKAINANLRLAVFRIAVKQGEEPVLETLKQLAQSSISVDGKEIALQAMASVQTPSLARQVLDFIFSPAVATQDVHTPAALLATNPKTRLAVWHFIRDEWDTVMGKLGKNLLVLDRFIRQTLKQFPSHEVGEEIGRFLASKDTRGWEMTVKIVGDSIEGQARYRERDEGAVEEWLGVRGYA